MIRKKIKIGFILSLSAFFINYSLMSFVLLDIRRTKDFKKFEQGLSKYLLQSKDRGDISINEVKKTDCSKQGVSSSKFEKLDIQFITKEIEKTGHPKLFQQAELNDPIRMSSTIVPKKLTISNSQFGNKVELPSKNEQMVSSFKSVSEAPRGENVKKTISPEQLDAKLNNLSANLKFFFSLECDRSNKEAYFNLWVQQFKKEDSESEFLFFQKTSFLYTVRDLAEALVEKIKNKALYKALGLPDFYELFNFSDIDISDIDIVEQFLGQTLYPEDEVKNLGTFFKMVFKNKSLPVMPEWISSYDKSNMVLNLKNDKKNNSESKGN